MCHCWYQYTVMLAPALCLFLFSSCNEIKVKGKEEHVKYILCCWEISQHSVHFAAAATGGGKPGTK